MSRKRVLPGRPEVSREQYEAADILGYLLAGPLTFGGLGWLLDAWWGIGVLLPVGVLLGVGLGLYVVWLRYGKV